MSSLEIFNCEQGTETWLQCRLGIPTASMFSAVLAKGEGKTRRSYMLKLASEIITGDVGETFQSGAMDRGKIMESEARELYSIIYDDPLSQVGFIRNGTKGASPDSLVGDKGGLEIKTQRADLLIETLLKDQFPPEHKAQCQGLLWVAEREWVDICVYWPRMPLFVKRAVRDEAYIADLSKAVDVFNAELADLVEKVRKYA